MVLKRVSIILLVCTLPLTLAGCSETKGDDYNDAPEAIKDGSLDYQDYKEAGCPYLDGSLDQQDMKKCNEWIRNQNMNNNTTTTET